LACDSELDLKVVEFIFRIVRATTISIGSKENSDEL